jgi:hypothetical protein
LHEHIPLTLQIFLFCSLRQEVMFSSTFVRVLCVVLCCVVLCCVVLCCAVLCCVVCACCVRVLCVHVLCVCVRQHDNF